MAEKLDGDELLDSLEGLTEEDTNEVADQLAEQQIMIDLKNTPAVLEQEEWLDKLQKEYLSIRNPAIWNQVN